MKYFLKNITLFIGIPTILLGSSMFILKAVNTNALIAQGTISKVFVGDSHMQCGIDPTQFEEASNIATNSEHYFFSYYKLRKFTELNPSVNEAFVGFSYHNISSYYDSHFDGEYADISSSKSFFFLPRKYQIQFAMNTQNGVSAYYKSIIKRSYSAYRNRLFGFDNHFVNSNANQSSMDKRIKTQFYNEGELRTISESNMFYLGKIIEFCKRKNIQLTFITTPVHPYYRKNIPLKFKETYAHFKDTTSVAIIDFDGLILETDHFAPDGDHVSLKTIETLSEFINEQSVQKK